MSLDVALLVDTDSLQEWEHQAVSHLLHESGLNVNISLVVVNSQEVSSSLGQKASTFVTEFSLWNCFVAMRMLKTAVTEPPWYRKQVALDQTMDLADVNTISCIPDPADNFGNELPDNAVSELAKVDVAIRFGFGILKGEALDAPTYGVLSYHHGDISEYRGRPAGFYEFIKKEPTAGVTVQQLTEELDAGTVVATTKCNIEDCTSLREVHSKQFSASPPLLTAGIQALINDQLPEQPEELGPAYTTPSDRDILIYLWRRVTSTVLK
jgi:folate-dependent phosphoribosylglycinamide formyltransferase PurN